MQVIDMQDAIHRRQQLREQEQKEQLERDELQK